MRKKIYYYFRYVLITDTRYQFDIISSFWFLIFSMKMSIFSIITNIMKAIINDIITRNDIIGTLITIYRLHLSEITDTNTKNNGRWWPIPITDPIISTSLYILYADCKSRTYQKIFFQNTIFVQPCSSIYMYTHYTASPGNIFLIVLDMNNHAIIIYIHCKSMTY